MNTRRRLVAALVVATSAVATFAYSDSRHRRAPSTICASKTAAPGSAMPGCDIDIMEMSLLLTPMIPSQIAHVTRDPMSMTLLKAASLSGMNPTAFTLSGSGCSGQSCDFGAGIPVVPPFPLTISCTPGPTAQFAQLDVTGTVMDSDSAQLECGASTTTGPILSLSTTMVAADADVNATSNGNPDIVISNVGSGSLMVTLTPPAAPWSIVGNTCVTPPCSITSGSPVTVQTRFAPTMPGPQASSIGLTSNDPAHTTDTISLTGLGVGSTLTASPSDLTFVIPKSQAFPQTVMLTAAGNEPLSVTLADPGAPFSVTPSTVNLTPGMPAMFSVSCMSPTPHAQVDSSVTLMSAAYQELPASIAVHCTIVDTNVTVSPMMFDFGERRLGTGPQDMMVTVANGGSTPAQLMGISLSDTRPGLALTGPASLPPTLAPTDSVTAHITLDPVAETDLEGVSLHVDVDGTTIALPVRGKVVRAASHVAPEQLDLGTVCLGSQAVGTVRLVNDGTATLMVQPPMMDPIAFATMFQSPTTYPATLPAGETAAIDVSASTTAAGMEQGTLTWDDDVTSHYVVPVTVEVIESGTAVSPSSLDFGQIKIDFTSTRETIVLENCNESPVTVNLDGIVVTSGDRDAWDVSPTQLSQMLLPHGSLTITAAFTPHHNGHHAAHLDVSVDGDTRRVLLAGDAFGGLDDTSFYACACSSGGVLGGWPIAFALVAVVRRRRRRA